MERSIFRKNWKESGSDGMLSQRKQNRWGYLFIAPAIIGLVCFSLGPMLFSLGISFFQWDIITPPVFAGLENYREVFSDPLVKKSLSVTLIYTLITVPLITAVPLLEALLLNVKVRGIAVFRTCFYIPSIVPMAANSAIWMYLYNPMFGPLNQILKTLNLPQGKFLYSMDSVLPCLAVMAVWFSGNTMIIYLARLKELPGEIYEAAALDGAGSWTKFRNLTVPLMTPVIFYNLVMAVIGTMQTFTQVYIMTEGGPANSSLLYAMLIYRNAFKQSKMGYSAAMSWVLFLLMGLITLILFKTSKYWVYEESGE